MNHLDRYYALLELPFGAPPQEIRRAYRDLVKVWHPDRFAHDPRLQHQAQEKLKALNEAYVRLMSGLHIPKNWRWVKGSEPQGTRSSCKTAKDPYRPAQVNPQVFPKIFQWPHKFGGLLSPLLLGSLLLLLIACLVGSPHIVMSLVRQLNHSMMVNHYFYFIIIIWGVLVFLFVESLME